MPDISMRRPRPRAATAVFLALTLAACAPHADGVLKVASQKGGTRALLEASHVLDGAPYKVEWSEFPSAQTLLEAVSDGAADVGAAGDAPFLFAYASGAHIKALQALRYGSDGSSVGIIVPTASPIHATADLKGRKIATGRGSIGHYLLLRALESAGLKSKDVTVVYLSPGDAKAALGSGAVDAWATWYPYLGLGTRQGEDRIVVTGKGLINSLGFQAANTASLAAKGAQLTDFAQRLDKAYVWQTTHKAEYAAVLTKDTGLPPDIALALGQHLQPHAIPIDEALIAEEQATLAHFQAAGVIASAPDVRAALAR